MPIRDTAWPPGTPCWVDYGAADLDAAQRFYADVLGWTYTGGEPEYGGYLSSLVRDRVAAGLGPRMEPAAPPAWTTYFATDDADATAAAVGGAGGTVVVPPMQVGPLGRMTVALDPQGQTFGFWESGEHTGVRVYNEPGALIWNEAAFDDPEQARVFYGAVFGFSFAPLPGVDGYTTFGTGGDPLGGLGGRTPGAAAGWTACFCVGSTDRAVAAAQAGGATVAAPAEDSAFGRFAVLTDPWGAAFSVLQTDPD